jgi:hypothetical protein
VNAFVDECRREWRRLRVPDGLADEMAAELEADLAEAGSIEELLGTAPVDASLFARNWAAERGLAAAPRRRRSLLPASLATLALAAAIAGAALTINESTSDSSRPPSVALEPGDLTVPSQRTAITVIREQAAAENARRVADNAHLQARFVAPDEVEGTTDQSNTLGVVLLITGLAALVPLTLVGLRPAALDR